MLAEKKILTDQPVSSCVKRAMPWLSALCGLMMPLMASGVQRHDANHHAEAVAGAVTPEPSRLPRLDDFLNLTELGAVRPSPDGTLLALEVYRPRNVEVQTNDAERQDIWLIEVATGKVTRLTDGAMDARAAWSPIWAPDSQRLAMLHSDGSRMQPAVWHRSTGKLSVISERSVDFQVNFGKSRSGIGAREWGVWVDAGTMMMQFQAAGRSRDDRSAATARPEAVWNELWSDLGAGQASVTVWDSRHPKVCGRENVLATVDVANGRTTELVSGAVRAVSLSPDRRFAAAVLATRPKGYDRSALMASVLDYNQTYTDAHVETELRVVDLVARKDLGPALGVGGVNFISPRRFPRWADDSGMVAVPVYSGPGQNATVSVAVPGLQVQRMQASSTLDAEVLAELLSLNGGNPESVATRTQFGAADMVPAERLGSWGFRVPGRVLRTPRGQVAVSLDGKLRVLDSTGRAGSALPMDGNVVWPEPGDAHVAGVVMGRAGDYHHVDLLASPSQAIHIPKPTPGATLVAVVGRGDAYVFTAVQNDGTYLWVGKGGDWKKFEWNTHLRNIIPARQRIYQYTLPSGETFAGRVWLPYGYVEGQRSPAVMVGYPGTMVGGARENSLNSFYFYPYNLLAAAGYLVIEPTLPYGDPEGYEPLRHFSDLALYGLEGAIREGYVDPQRVGFMGNSNGGYLGLALQTTTDRFKAIVATAAFPDLIDLSGIPYPFEAISECAPSLMRQRGPLYLETAGMPLYVKGSPHEELERYLRNSAYFQLRNATTPLLLTYGEFDATPTAVRKYFVALDRLGVPVQLAQYWGEGHNLQSRANVSDAWGRALAWFDQYVRPTP